MVLFYVVAIVIILIWYVGDHTFTWNIFRLPSITFCESRVVEFVAHMIHIEVACVIRKIAIATIINEVVIAIVIEIEDAPIVNGSVAIYIYLVVAMFISVVHLTIFI